MPPSEFTPETKASLEHLWEKYNLSREEDGSLILELIRAALGIAASYNLDVDPLSVKRLSRILHMIGEMLDVAKNG